MSGPVSFLKALMPRSLFGRAFLILVLPVVLLQGVVATIFVQRHYDGVTVQMAQVVARELDVLATEIDAAEDHAAAEAVLAELSKPLDLELRLDAQGRVEPRALRAFYDVTGGVIEETLKSGISRPVTLDLVSVPKSVIARVLTGKGVLEAEIPRRRMNPANPHQLLVFTTLAALALIAVAVVFLRNQVRPIRQLSQAAAAFGRGQSLPFRPAGAEEVRRAGYAFLDMRTRIERQIQARTRMLSGVSHDLRTPLTRMKLALAMSEEGPETAELRRDVEEMEHMLDAYLAFVRGEEGEAAEPVDPAALLDEVARDARRAGARLRVVSQTEDAGGPVTVRPRALKRALVNLVDNARVHGREVVLGLRAGRRSVEFTVEDDGPGIPPERREEATRPFARLDPARGRRGRGGVGLGLSIALDIARSHGGGLELDESPGLGGLRATLRLPR